MDNKRKNDNDAKKSGKVKINALKLNKETVKDLTDNEAKRVLGGRKNEPTRAACSNPCPATKLLCPHKTTVPAGCPPTVVNG
jgi:hypothetical protein